MSDYRIIQNWATKVPMVDINDELREPLTKLYDAGFADGVKASQAEIAGLRSEVDVAKKERSNAREQVYVANDTIDGLRAALERLLKDHEDFFGKESISEWKGVIAARKALLLDIPS